jgi:uncharacterized protein (TIGR00251 family)
VELGGWWSAHDTGITIRLRVTPGARRSEVIDVSGDRLRVRIAAPAVEGKANAELQRFLARLFGVRRSAVSVVSGTRSRDKTISIAGVASPPNPLRTIPDR